MMGRVGECILLQDEPLIFDPSSSIPFPQAFAPLITLNAFIQQQPNSAILGPQFPSIASGLIAQLPPSTFQALQFQPMGLIEVWWIPCYATMNSDALIVTQHG